MDDPDKYDQISGQSQIETQYQNIFLIKAVALLGPAFQDSQ